MGIEIQQDQHGSLKVLALSGRLDTETAVDVELALQDLMAAGERQFLIDLSGVSYVSSAGLRVLLGLAKQLDGGKGILRLCGLSAPVQQVFNVAGFSKLFAIFPDRAAAGGSLPQPKPETELAAKAAALIGAKGAAPASHPQAPELARSAAQLLGVKPGAAPKKPAPAAPAKSASAPVAAPARADRDEQPAPGVLGKLRGLFGGKR